jgi:hypothetical protein
MKGKSAQGLRFRWYREIALVGLLLSIVAQSKWVHAEIGSITAEFSAENGAATYTISYRGACWHGRCTT